MAAATKKELREFGLVVGIAFALLGGLMWWKHGHVDPKIFWGISAFLIVSGLLVPVILRPFQWFWMKLAHVLGYVMNRVLLGLIFYIIFTFVAMIMRAIKRDIMERHPDKAVESYWKLRDGEPVPAERYERQF